MKKQHVAVLAIVTFVLAVLGTLSAVWFINVLKSLAGDTPIAAETVKADSSGKPVTHCEVPLNYTAVVRYGKGDKKYILRMNNFGDPSSELWGVMMSVQMSDGKIVSDETLDPKEFFTPYADFDGALISADGKRTLKVNFSKEAGICEITENL
jgi:hypothetical protein